jgi:glutamine synthetase adenylyltransferase
MLQEPGLLDHPDARVLQRNALFLRGLEHAIRLVTGKAGKWLPSSEPARHSIEQLMQSLLDGKETVASRLDATLQQNRYIYARYSQTQ